MTAPSFYARSLACTAKRISPSQLSAVHPRRRIQHAAPSETDQDPSNQLDQLRLPRAVQATYLTPMKRLPERDDPIGVCDLQLRSYSIRNLEIFADFALRAAYFLGMPASGPVPLPKIVERWTVPKGHFIHKKSQENFERITRRRLIQIQDGHHESVAVWLAFLRKYQYYGVGMKANVFAHEGLDAVEDMEKEAELIEAHIGGQLVVPDAAKKTARAKELILNAMEAEPFKAQWGAYGPQGAATSVPLARAPNPALHALRTKPLKTEAWEGTRDEGTRDEGTRDE